MNRINLVCLGIRDMEKSLAFYKNIGLKTYVKENNPPIVFFDNQGSKLELYPIEKLAEDINADHSPEVCRAGFCGITLACNMKSEREVDDLMSTVANHGGTVVKKPGHVFLGRLQWLFSGSGRLLLGNCLWFRLGV